MKIKVDRKALVGALDKAKHAAAKRATLPVLENVCIQASGDQAYLTATNLEVGLRCTLPAQPVISVWELQAGSPFSYGGYLPQSFTPVTVPCKGLADAVKSLPDGDVTLETIQTGKALAGLQVESGKRVFRLNGIPADEFPVFPNYKECKVELLYSLSADMLLELLGKVEPCIAPDDTRPILTTVLFSHEGLTAADGFKLAHVPLGFDAPKHTLPIRKPTIDLLRKVLKDPNAIVSLYYNPDARYCHQVHFVASDLEIVGTTDDGTFPDRQQIIPIGHQVELSIPTGVLRDEIKRADLVVRQAANTVLLSVDGKESTLQVSAHAVDVGDFSAVLDCTDVEIGTQEPKDLTIALDASQLIALLGSPAFGKEDKARLHWKSPKHPLLLTNPDVDDGAQYVLMPMHIGR